MKIPGIQRTRRHRGGNNERSDQISNYITALHRKENRYANKTGFSTIENKSIR